MLLAYVVDQLVRSVNAAVYTQSSKWDGAYIEVLLPQVKAEAQGIAYNGSRARAGNKMISPQWVLPVDVVINAAIQNQDAEYLIAQVPSFIRINQKTDGLVYCGGANIAVNFHRCYTVTEIDDLKRRSFLQGGEIVYIPVGKYVRFYGDKALKSFQVNIVPTDPLTVPGFNPLTDDYPIDPDTLSIMKDLFIQRARIEMGMPADVVNDNAQTNELGVIKNNLNVR